MVLVILLVADFLIPGSSVADLPFSGKFSHVSDSRRKRSDAAGRASPMPCHDCDTVRDRENYSLSRLVVFFAAAILPAGPNRAGPMSDLLYPSALLKPQAEVMVTSRGALHPVNNNCALSALSACLPQCSLTQLSKSRFRATCEGAMRRVLGAPIPANR